MGKKPQDNKSAFEIREKLGEFWQSFSYLIQSHRLTIADVAKIADKKEKERGGFSNNIFLVEISGPISNPIIQKYLNSYKKRESRSVSSLESNSQ